MKKIKHAQLVSQSYWEGESPYSEPDIEKIITCLKVDLTPPQRKIFIAELIMHTQDFQASYKATTSNDNMSAPELRKRLIKGQKMLTEALNVVNYPFKIQRLLREHISSGAYDAALGKKACAKHLRILLSSIQRLEESLPIGKGDNWPVKQYIRRLKTLYETTTGTKAKRIVEHHAEGKSKDTGRFYIFVDRAWPSDVARSSLTGIIREVLKEPTMDK